MGLYDGSYDRQSQSSALTVPLVEALKDQGQVISGSLPQTAVEEVDGQIDSLVSGHGANRRGRLLNRPAKIPRSQVHGHLPFLDLSQILQVVDNPCNSHGFFMVDTLVLRTLVLLSNQAVIQDLGVSANMGKRCSELVATLARDSRPLFSNACNCDVI